MQRREFISFLGGAAAASSGFRPLIARAQQSALPVVGYLGAASATAWAGRLQAFKAGLKETGYVEGQNVAIEYRWADGKPERLQTLADELIQRGVGVIVTPGSAPAALAAKAATRTIPIVFETGADPVAIGLVSSLNRPGGNVTGVTAMSFELGPKRLEMMHEAVPAAKKIGLLLNPANPYAERLTAAMVDAGRSLGLKVEPVHASNVSELENVFARLSEVGAEALLTNPDPFLNSRIEHLAAQTIQRRIPTVSHFRSFVTSGGLMSYGGDISDTHRLAGTYAGRILKGEKPTDLPVQQSTKVELVVNLKAAKALGLTLPPALLARADEVLE